MSSIETLERRERASAARPHLRLVTTRPARPETSSVAVDEQPVNLKIGFRELVLIHRSLEAVRTLALVEGQDDLLTDTLQLIDVALEEAV
ncbi:MAG: hypothetical protein ACJ750_01760 [Gaiellaceae bacterium]